MKKDKMISQRLKKSNFLENKYKNTKILRNNFNGKLFFLGDILQHIHVQLIVIIMISDYN